MFFTAENCSKSPVEAADEYFDLLIKSRFVEEFGNIQTNSKGWKTNKLGSLATFKTGGTPSSKHPEYYEGTIPFISTPALGPNYIDETSAKYKITEAAINSCATTLIPAGSLIVGTRINVGKSSINTVNLCTNQDIVSLMDVSKKYELLFLKHCIDQYIPYLDSQKKGATIKGITTELLKSISIPEPPIEQQKSYVDFVKQVDKSKVKFHQLIESYDTLIKSRFVEIFGDPVSNPKGWEKKKLRDLLIIERGGSPRPISAFVTDDENGLNWIKIGDAVEESYYIDHVEEKIKPEGLNKTRQVYPGDLILSNSMSFGKPYILNISGCIHDGWLVLRDSKEVFNKLFLCMALGCPTVTHTFQSMARGAVVKNLNKDLVGNFDMFLPPRKLQDEFVQFIKQVDKSKFEVIYRLQKLKESISPTAPSE